MTTLMEKSVRRIDQLDYLKCIFITLMVIFHLVYIGDKYPYAKQVVYTFHMPAFLVLSGYLLNVRKEVRPFLRNMGWIFIPYAVMEAAYVLGASLLPVREHIGHLTFPLLMEKVLLSPIGPYWYLHTLVLCSLLYYAVHRLGTRLHLLPFIVVLGVVLAGVSYGLHLCSPANAFYFLVGAAVRRSGRSFLDCFPPLVWAIVPAVVLCCFPGNLNRFTPGGMVITYCVICFLLWTYQRLPQRILSSFLMIGRNTLPILLFSPLFTILSKSFLPFLAFDPTGMLFLCLATAFTLAGSLGIAWVMDRCRVSRWFCGKEKMLQ